jgi:hypothetical protein
MKNPISKIKSALRGESATQGKENRSDAAGLEKHLSTLPSDAQNSSEPERSGTNSLRSNLRWK